MKKAINVLSLCIPRASGGDPIWPRGMYFMYNMRMDKYVVKIFWGEEGKVWIAVCDEIPPPAI